jgi:hypothetical protein
MHKAFELHLLLFERMHSPEKIKSEKQITKSNYALS